MCGIVGTICAENLNHKEADPLRGFFYQSLFADTLRGYDGTGVFGITSSANAKTHMFKMPVAAPDFLDHKRADKFIKDAHLYKFMVGHNRWKTRGMSNKKNTHPFTHGDITMVHNGTLSFFNNLTKEKFDTDSETICKALSEVDDPEEVIEQLEGSFTLVWYDARIDSLRIIRNEDRPLSIGLVKDRNVAVFASEPGMLYWIAGRNGIPLKNVFTPKPGFLHTYKDDVRNPDVKKCKLHSPYHKGSRVVGSASDSDLRNLGISAGERVKLVPLYWEPYNMSPNTTNDTQGRLYCHCEEYPDINFAVSSTNKNFYACNKYIFANPNFVCAPGTDEEYVACHRPIESSLYIPGERAVPKKDVYTSFEAGAKAKKLAGGKGNLREATGKSEDSDKGKSLPAKTPRFLGPGKKEISREEFSKLTKNGCAMCGDPIMPDSGESVEFDIWENAYCKTCYSNHNEVIVQHGKK